MEKSNIHADKIVAEELNEFEQAVALLRRLHVCKATQYLDSWCKRGEPGVYNNVMRKLDRLENIYQPYADHTATITDWFPLADTLADTGVYSIKWLARLKKWHPDAYEALQVYVVDQEKFSGKILSSSYAPGVFDILGASTKKK